ncbi:MAG: cytochrome c biogenesis protein CcsA [Syntrophales bacterium]|nr:cytochrome c biogenesis protein CcsA [Syntrophales bacterium]PKN60241.1 MAG: c-type cytochrome biogenesis protein CcsB [Deltaproteobacteria bacterium HGW-Deltaproteobacteria-11]
MDILFFKLALAAYLISTLGYIASLLVRRVLIAKISTWILVTAFTLHTAFYLAQLILTQALYVKNVPETLSFFAWILCGIYLLLQLKTKTRVLGAFISPVAFLLMVGASAGVAGSVSIPDTLKGGLVTLHVTLSVAGEALFALASCAGAMYLIQNRLIKRKSIGSFSRLLPSLKELDNINHICLLWGFPLLTLGVLIGSVWARTVWGSHWQWDPKQIWTLAAWLLYALLLHQRLAIGWKGHRVALFSVLAFLILLAGFFLEKAFFNTLHNFM